MKTMMVNLIQPAFTFMVGVALPWSAVNFGRNLLAEGVVYAPLLPSGDPGRMGGFATLYHRLSNMFFE
jgi:hypothetical protein